MDSLSLLPTGRQDFATLIRDGCLYVDKTQDIFRMAEKRGYNFLSRPRRFGKSLTRGTLKYLFEGRKELFKGLWIDDKWDWSKSFPVIYLDFNNIFKAEAPLSRLLCTEMDDIAYLHSLTLEKETAGEKFREIIEKLNQKTGTPVVVLIDEYDKPIINYLGTDTEQALANRDRLNEFLLSLKTI